MWACIIYRSALYLAKHSNCKVSQRFSFFKTEHFMGGDASPQRLYSMFQEHKSITNGSFDRHVWFERYCFHKVFLGMQIFGDLLKVYCVCVDFAIAALSGRTVVTLLAWTVLLSICEVHRMFAGLWEENCWSQPRLVLIEREQGQVY